MHIFLGNNLHEMSNLFYEKIRKVYQLLLLKCLPSTLTEALLMNTKSICFCEEIKKYYMDTPIMWSYITDMIG